MRWLILAAVLAALTGCEKSELPGEPELNEKAIESAIASRYVTGEDAPDVIEEKEPEKPKKPEKPLPSKLMDEISGLLRQKDLKTAKKVIEKYDKDLEKFYENDVKNHPELKEFAEPWMDGYRRMKEAVEAGDANRAWDNFFGGMIGSWKPWNENRRKLGAK